MNGSTPQLNRIAVDEVIQATGGNVPLGDKEARRTDANPPPAKTVAAVADKEKRRLLADIGHELRNPMNSILGMIEMALPKVADPMAGDCLRTAKESAEQLLCVLNDLLRAARVRSGRLEVDAVSFVSTGVRDVPADFPRRPVLPLPTRKLRILLAEDDPANQKLAAYVLWDRGHRVDIAGDGQEAVAMVEQNRYDAILMDVQMPNMDGLKATTMIRKLESGRRRVAIVALTAHAMEGDRDRCLAAGMDDYLSKPIDPDEMVALVERLAAQEGPSTPALPLCGTIELSGATVSGATGGLSAGAAADSRTG